jgi:DNA polymerase-3 subunit beta
VRALGSGAVEVEITDEEARITAARSQFAVRTIPAHEFPKLPEPAEDTVELDAQAFADALRQVVSAASNDESRPILTGVLMAAEEGSLRLVATDSYRLAVRDLPGTSVLAEGQSVLVPSHALKELARLLGEAETVTLRLGERDASFEVAAVGELGPVRLMTRLIEGEFPNYRGLIPKTQPNRLTVGRDALLDALRRVRLLAREATPVRLVMKPDSLELLAVTQDVGQAHEELDGKFEGNELTVAFNPEYLIAGIEVTPGDEITLETIDALKPALVRSLEGSEFLYLLMPVRVS